MNNTLELFYTDTMRRYLKDSPYYKDALQEWELAQGRPWPEVDDAAHLLAERVGYLSFLLAFRLGVGLGTELDGMVNPDL